MIISSKRLASKVMRVRSVSFATADLLPLYIDHLSVRALSAKHIEHCDQHLRHCQRTLGKLLAEITKQDLKRYDADLARRFQSKAIKQSTWRKYQASVRCFYKWAVADDHLTADPSLGAFVSPKLPKELPKFLEDGELAALLVAAGRSKYPERDQALIAVLAMCGLRISEALGLDWERLGDYAQVIGKGNKERRVPVPSPLRPYLDAWRAVHPHGGKGPVFTNTLKPYKRLKYDSNWRKYLPRLVQAAGLTRRVTSHHLRHTYATSLLRSEKVRLDQIQVLLGHENISTTQVYAKTRITNDTVAAINAALGG